MKGVEDSMFNFTTTKTITTFYLYCSDIQYRTIAISIANATTITTVIVLLY